MFGWLRRKWYGLTWLGSTRICNVTFYGGELHYDHEARKVRFTDDNGKLMFEGEAQKLLVTNCLFMGASARETGTENPVTLGAKTYNATTEAKE